MRRTVIVAVTMMAVLAGAQASTPVARRVLALQSGFLEGHYHEVSPGTHVEEYKTYPKVQL